MIVNNQVGFTTSLKTSRLPTASPYATDVAKTAAAPIFHVNGDDPEAVVHTMKLAAEYRQAFKKVSGQFFIYISLYLFIE